MCIIVYKPANIVLLPETIQNCFDNNSDGAGFSYVENNQIITQKGFTSLISFNEAYEPHKNKQALLHFRIRTHGSLETENCHPFEITDTLVFAHNGTITALPLHTEKSDTSLLRELVLSPLVQSHGESILDQSSIKLLISSFIGYSKLVFLNNRGEYRIINEGFGKWTDGCWFSNQTWQSMPIYVPQYKSYKMAGNISQLPLSKKAHKRLIKQQQREMRKYGGIPFSPLPMTNNRGNILQLGGYIRVTTDVNLAKKGWLGKIMGFYENHQLEIYFPIHKRLMKIPIIAVEPESPLLLPPPTEEGTYNE